MFVKSERISLRQVEPSDAQTIYIWENDTSVWHVSDTITPLSMYQIEQFILNAGDLFSEKQLRLMIDFHQHENKVAVGAVDLYDYDPRHSRAGLGILIDHPYRQKGVAAEALKLTENYCFEILGLHQLYCYVAANNTPSIGLFKKRGYELTGTRKEWLLVNNNWIDQLHFQKIKP